MSILRLSHLGGAALLSAALAAGCSDDLPTGSTSVTDCARGAGQTHSGTLPGSQTWTRRNGPHRLVDSVTTSGTITITAGALVCGTPGSILAPEVLLVEGTADMPVVLTATDSLVGWGGIRASVSQEQAVIRYANIRHAEVAVIARSSDQEFILDNTTIFRARGAAVVGGTVRLNNVVIDSACAVAGDRCAAVSVGSYSVIGLSQSAIRDSGGQGIHVSYRAGASVTDSEITGSRSVGIRAEYNVRGSGGVGLNGSVRITGGDSIPLSLPFGLPSGLEDRAAQLLLTGNAIDEIHFSGGTRGGTIYPELPWIINTDCVFGFGLMGTIRLEPGASVTVESRCYVDGEFLGAGTAENPVRIAANGIDIRSWDPLNSRSVPDSIYLEHARVTGARLSFEISRAVLEDIELDNGSLTFAAAGSRLTRAHVRGSTEDGVIVNADDVIIADCTIENNARHGVHVLTGEPRVERCDLQNNGGAGVSNAGTGTVDATDNWWGDPAGPHGPDGDGIAGAVLYVPYRTSSR